MQQQSASQNESPQPAWRVMRQDDNGNQFVIATYPDFDAAAAHLARFEDAEYPHHQMYWLEEQR